MPQTPTNVPSSVCFRRRRRRKKTELMALTSTSHVAPHIAGCISSVVIYLVQVELQIVLISTVSTFFLSSLSSSFSCLNLVHDDPARSLRLRPLPCEQQQPHSESCKGANRRLFLAAPGSNGPLRAARGGERAPGVAQDAAGERDDGAALASPPPCPRPAHRQKQRTGKA
jgi:hypothetical protein